MTHAPFALVRVAGLPYDDVAGLVPPRVRALIDAAVAAAAEMEAARPGLEDALLAAATTDDRALRRDLLALKRDVHSGRPPRADLVDVARTLDDRAAEVLGRWSRASAARAAAIAALDAAFDDGVDGHLRPQLNARARGDRFLRALALASAELTRALLDREVRPQQLASTKLERAILGYLIRAAADTTPFGGLSATGVLRLVQDAPEPVVRDDDRASRASVNRGHVAAIARALARAGLAPLAVAREARFGDDAVEALVTTWLEVARRRWRVATPRRTRLEPVLARYLRTRPAVRASTLTAAGLDDAAARGLIAKLVDAGVLVTTPAIDAFDPRPAATLAGALPDDAAAPLRLLEDAAAALPAAGAAERLAILDRLGADHAILEDGILSRAIDAPAGALTAISDDLIEALRPHVVERADHVRMRAAFVARFGHGGACRDVGAFLADLRHAPPATSQAARADRPPLPVAVLAQVARDDDGELFAVVDQVHAGGGAMAARWAMGDDDAATTLRAELRRWIATTSPGRRTVDVPVSGDCNPVQAHPRLTDAVLALPGEPCADADALEIADLVLEHDPRTDTLVLRGPSGDALQPRYLGATALTEAAGPAYWLDVLARPHEVTLAGRTPPVTGDDVAHHARRTHGRVVLERASTWVRSDRLRARWFKKSGAARLVDVADDLAALGAGATFCARRPDDARPLWVDSRNPFCLDVLERFAEGSSWVELVELLPEPGRSWPRSDRGARVTELLLEVLL